MIKIIFENLPYIAVIIASLVLLTVLLVYKRSLEVLVYVLAEKIKAMITIKGPFSAEFKSTNTDSTQVMVDISEGAEKQIQLLEQKEPLPEERWIDYFFEGDFDKAIEILETMIAKAKLGETDEVLVAKSFQCVCHTRKNFKDGILKFRQLIDAYPTKVTPYSFLVTEYERNGFFEEAIGIIDEGLQKIHNEVSLDLRKAEVFLKMKKYDSSLAILNDILSKDKTAIDAHLKMAEVYQSMGKDEKFEVVKTCYQNALKIDPQNEKALSEYAGFLYDKNMKVESLLTYKRLISLYPKNHRYWTLAGNIYLDSKLNNMAMRYYEKANSIVEGKEAWILENIGNLYRNVGLYDKSIEFLKKGLEIDHNSEYGHNRLSSALEDQTKQDKEAKEMLDKLSPFE